MAASSRFNRCGYFFLIDKKDKQSLYVSGILQKGVNKQWDVGKFWTYSEKNILHKPQKDSAVTTADEVVLNETKAFPKVHHISEAKLRQGIFAYINKVILDFKIKAKMSKIVKEVWILVVTEFLGNAKAVHYELMKEMETRY